MDQSIIPLREKIGNYDAQDPRRMQALNYTTTRENWELRHRKVRARAIAELYHYERKLGTTTEMVA